MIRNDTASKHINCLYIQKKQKHISLYNQNIITVDLKILKTTHWVRPNESKEGVCEYICNAQIMQGTASGTPAYL